MNSQHSWILCAGCQYCLGSHHQNHHPQCWNLNLLEVTCKNALHYLVLMTLKTLKLRQQDPCLNQRGWRRSQRRKHCRVCLHITYSFYSINLNKVILMKIEFTLMFMLKILNDDDQASHILNKTWLSTNTEESFKPVPLTARVLGNKKKQVKSMPCMYVLDFSFDYSYSQLIYLFPSLGLSGCSKKEHILVADVTTLWWHMATLHLVRLHIYPFLTLTIS